jgi:LysR family hydrogen peroxide-inducible transcriptional activator
MLTLKNLKYAVQLAKDLHFHTAAQHLCVAQSSLSAGIKSLEDYLGVQLFIRTNKIVILTPTGREILKKAHIILQNVENIHALAIEDFWKKTITIGVIPTISPYILPRFIQSVQYQYPHLKCNIVETTSANLITKINNLEIDFAIFALPYALPNTIAHQILFTDILCYIKHQNYQGNNILLLDEGHCLREHILGSTHIENTQIMDFNCSSINTLIAMVNMELAGSFIPQMALQIEMKNYPKIMVGSTYKGTRDIGVIYHKEYTFISQILELSKLIKII